MSITKIASMHDISFQPFNEPGSRKGQYLDFEDDNKVNRADERKNVHFAFPTQMWLLID